MKASEIQELFNSFESIAIEYDGVECWSAREIAPVMGYVQWRNFSAIIEKAKESATNAGESIADHFADVSKMVFLIINFPQKNNLFYGRMRDTLKRGISHYLYHSLIRPKFNYSY